MNMKNKNRVYLIVILLAFIACDNTDYSNQTPCENGIYLNVAEKRSSETMTFNKTITEQARIFTAKLAYPAETDVSVNVSVQSGLVDLFNAKNRTDYVSLPEKFYQLEQSEAIVKAGKINSDPLHIQFSNLTELEIDKSYLCPVTLTSPQGVGLLHGSATYWYVVKRSSAITTAVNLNHCYVEVPGFYVPKGGTTPQGNAAHLNGMKAFTFEMIVRINSIDQYTEITSLMGIEQYCCFRMGDAGFQRRQLQVQTPAGKFPETNKSKLLNLGEWYHLAITYDVIEKTIIFYVNGKEQSKDTGYGTSDFAEINLAKAIKESSPGEGDGEWLFYIGRSYNDRWEINRQLNGNVCEVRIWDTARIPQEIWTNMYDIHEPEKEEHLAAYWKFNEGSGNEIKDHSRYGNNAQIVRYWKDAANKIDYEVEDSELWPSGIEVPQINREE